MFWDSLGNSEELKTCWANVLNQVALFNANSEMALEFPACCVTDEAILVAVGEPQLSVEYVDTGLPEVSSLSLELTSN